MIDSIAEKYALTHEGAKNLLKGILYTTLLNISFMFPIGLYVLLLSQFMSPLLDKGYVQPNLVLYLVGIIICSVIIFIFAWKQYYFVFNTMYDSSIERRVSLAENIRKLPLSFFEKKDLSDLTATVMGDCTDLEHMFSHAIPQLGGSILSVILITIGLLTINVYLTISLVWVIPVSFGLLIITKKIQEKHSKLLLEKSRETTDSIQECIDSIEELKSYNYEKQYLEKIGKKVDNQHKIKINNELLMGIIINASKMILKLAIVCVLLVGANLIVNNQITIFTFLIFIIAASCIYIPLENALMYLTEILNTNVKIERMNNLTKQVNTNKDTDYHVNNYDINFENVYFSYDTQKDVLKNVTFTAKQNEVTALIGPSGGGKSTVSKLASAFWNPTKGRVKLDDVDLSMIDNEKILENYSIVFQDVILFNNTILENIRIGKKDATNEEIYKAAEIAQCSEFIEKLPDGYNTNIGENGLLLSGGQRQRISIARAILKDAPIIILDEATSFLDVENESIIQTAINNLIKDKTVIVIAHRMRTIANADKIIVLKEGEIVEQGTPDQLIKNKGLFDKMVNIQSKSSKWKI